MNGVLIWCVHSFCPIKFIGSEKGKRTIFMGREHVYHTYIIFDVLSPHPLKTFHIYTKMRKK